MRKYIAIIFTALGLMLTACGNNSTTNGNSDRTLENETEIEVGTKVESPSDSESTSSDAGTGTDESGASDTSDTEYSHVHGPYVKVHYPAYLTKLDTWLYGDKREDRSDTDKVYFLFNMDIMYEENHPGEEFEAHDVPEILSKSIMHTLREAYPSNDEDFSMDVKTEEETEVLGEKFIYRTGTIHVEELDESADLNYSAYFGIMPFSKYSDDITPICWIAFTESNDPQVLNEIDEVAKNAAEMAVYDEY